MCSLCSSMLLLYLQGTHPSSCPCLPSTSPPRGQGQKETSLRMASLFLSSFLNNLFKKEEITSRARDEG